MLREFELLHPAGIHISPSLTQEALSTSFVGQVLSRQDMGTGWVWLRLPTFQDGDVIVGLSLGFNCGRLERITLTDANPKFGTSWNDWSEKQEHFRAEKIGHWLTGKGYPPGSYSWGAVWASYDVKGGFGSAGVRFAT